jgi:hypothetical protein
MRFRSEMQNLLKMRMINMSEYSKKLSVDMFHSGRKGFGKIMTLEKSQPMNNADYSTFSRTGKRTDQL